MRILAEELEIAKREEGNARAKRIAEKEMEIAGAEGGRACTVCATSCSNPFEKVPSWLDEIGCDKKLTNVGKEVSRIALVSEPIEPNLYPCHT